MTSLLSNERFSRNHRTVGNGGRFLLLAAIAWSTACSSDEPVPSAGAGGAPVNTGGVVGSGGTGGATGGAAATGGSLAVGGSTGGVPSGGGGGATGGSVGAGGAGEIQTSADFEVEVKLASEEEPSAPTTVGIVTWSLPTSTVQSAYVEFGLDDGYGTQAPVDLSETGFRTLLLGMKPSTTYHFRVVAMTDTGTLASEDQTVETGAATTLVDLAGFNVLNDGAHEDGFIVTSFWRGNPGLSVVFILDADGDIVWWYDSGANGVASARMSADGKNLWMVEPSNQGAAVRRVSMDTLDGQTYSMTVGSHDLTPVSGSTMAFIEYGEPDCNSIFTIEPDGTTAEVFDSEEVASGQCHANALRYSKTEDVFTLSDVSTDVWVISRSGQYQWGLAERVQGGVSAWGGRNHGHHLLDDSFIIFANDGAGQMESSVVEYDLEGNEIFRYDGGQYSANLGDVQRLPGGNTLVTYSNDGVIHEITPEKELVLEIRTTGQSFGYSLWRKTLYGEPEELEL